MEKPKRDPQSKELYPLFQGLNEMGIGDAALADVLAESRAQVAEWRLGRRRMPGHAMACLTEFLNGLVQGRRSELSYATPMGLDLIAEDLNVLRRTNDSLNQQRAFNRALAKRDIERGERLLRDWRRRRLTASRTPVAVPPVA
ncbi:MAG: hypothetical protein VW268_00280 [Rhodospirillaceae bacterium]